MYYWVFTRKIRIKYEKERQMEKKICWIWYKTMMNKKKQKKNDDDNVIVKKDMQQQREGKMEWERM